MANWVYAGKGNKKKEEVWVLAKTGEILNNSENQSTSPNSSIIPDALKNPYDINNIAKVKGFNNLAEMDKYQQSNPNLYEAMGGVKYNPIPSNNPTMLKEEYKSVISDAQKADKAYKDGLVNLESAKNNVQKTKTAYEAAKGYKGYGTTEKMLNYIGGVNSDYIDKTKTDYEKSAAEYVAIKFHNEAAAEKELKKLEEELKSLKSSEEDIYNKIVSGYMRAGKSKEEAEKIAASDKRVIEIRENTDNNTSTEKEKIENEIDILRTALYGKYTVGQYLLENVNAGAARWNQSVSATADFTVGNVLNLFGWEDNPVSKWNDWHKEELEKAQTRANNAAKSIGDNNNIGGEITQGVVMALPDALFALATGGMSKAAIIAPKTVGFLNNTRKVITAVAKNPNYWLSFGRELGSNYEQAKQDGATETQATLYTLLASTVNAAIEIGGGIQTLPESLQQAYKKNGLWTWFKSALEEGGEENIQGIISGLTEKLIYNPDKEVASFNNENAIINPKILAKEFALGTAIGGILGGGQLAVDTVVNAKTETAYKNIGKAVLNDKSIDINGVVDYAKKSLDDGIRELALETDVNKITPRTAGILYKYAVNDISSAINTAESIELATKNYENIIGSTQSPIINSIASSQYVLKLMENGMTEESAIAQTENINSSLQSVNDSGIINSSNNINGVEDNELYQQGTVGRSTQGYKTQGGADTRRASGENRVFGETEESFTRRTQEAGNSNRQIVRHGSSALFYAEKSVDNSPASQAVKLLNKAGVKAVYCDGDIETNENGMTKIHTEALTAPDGTVYVSSNSSLNDLEIATHEGVHSKEKTNSEAFIEYEAVLSKNLLLASNNFYDICNLININHYGGKYDVEDVENANLFIREILAYTNQFVVTDIAFAENLFKPLFSDWNAVVEAVHKFNNDIGLDIPDTSVLQSSAKDNVTESSFDTPSDVSSQSGVGGVLFSEPDKKKIYREPTAEENTEAIFGRRKDAVQRHISDIAQRLDSNLRVVFVDKNSETLSGKNGKYIREINTIYLAKDMPVAEMYFEVFKHEFVHRLESKSAYKAFKEYLINKSRVFEEYVRLQLKLINGEDFSGSRNDAINALTNHYYNTFTGDKSIGKPIRDRFTLELAQREIVADFAGDILFKGNKNRMDITQSLADEDITAIGNIETSLSALEELARTDRNLFQKLWDIIKDFINSLKTVAQNKSLVADLEYIEQRLARVYDSKDTKKAAKQSGGVQYSLKNYSEHQIENWKNSKRIVVYQNEAQFYEFVENSKKDKSYVKKLYFGAIPTEYANFIKQKTGVDVENYNCTLESEKIRKIFNDHGNIDKEKLRGQKAVTIEDILNIPKVLLKPDDIILSNDLYEGKPVINFIKIYGNEKTIVTAVVSDKHLDLFVQTMYINKKGSITTPTDVQASVNTPKATRGTASTNNRISQNNSDVNNKSMPKSENYSDKGQFSVGSPMQIARENLKKYENGELSREQYLEENERLWGEAIQKYGSIEEGENAQAPIQTPKAVENGKLTERFIRTVIETGKLTDEALENIEEKVLTGNFSYAPISDDAAIKKADTAFKNGTAEEIWENALNDGKIMSKEKIAVGEKLLCEAIKKGDTKSVLILSGELADAFTNAGQVVQAARLIKKMTGAGRLISAQRMVRTINKDLQKRYGLDQKPIRISEESARRLANAKTEKGIENAYGVIMQEVADQMPSTWVDKFTAWRYFSMLSNPRTHIRNIIGNGIFLPMVRIKDYIACGLEGIAEATGKMDAAERTKQIVIKKEYADFAKADGENSKVTELLKGNKYNDKNIIREKQKIFKTEALNFLTDLNSNLLESEDMLFKNKHYVHALASFLQSRKADLNNLSEQLLDEARIYAVKEAKKATFNDENALANWIQDFSNKNIVTNIAVEGVLPYKRTPINIIRRGVEYSPIGLGATITKGLYDVKKGKITVAEYIDGLAAGITGTGVMLVGMFLANLGVVVGGLGDDNEEEFEKMMGKQEYSIEIFGKSYTIDWSAPSIIPFMIGTEIVNTMRSGEEFNFADTVNILGNFLEPITELSCLSGLKSVIEATKYADGSQIFGAVAGDILTSYAMQSIPSLMGATARSVDSTQRSWYTDKNSTWLSSGAQAFLNNVRSKIPGLTYTQIPKINAWGQEVSRGNAGERLAENFISPGYYSRVDYSDINNELLRLGKATGENVYPQTAKKYFNVGENTKNLTAEEYVTYAKAKGEYSQDYIDEFMSDKSYGKLTDEEKAKVIKKLYEYANAKAKTTVSDYDLLKNYKTVTKRERNGHSAVDYYIYQVLKD